MYMHRCSVLFKNLHILAIFMSISVEEMPVFPGLNQVFGVFGALDCKSPLFMTFGLH